MWNVVKRILLEASGFLMQQVVGTGSNWVLGPIIYATYGPWVAYVIMFVVNYVKLIALVYTYDKLSGWLSINGKSTRKKKQKNRYRRTKMLLRYGYRVLGVVAILVNNFYGALLVRRKHKGIPRGARVTVFWGITASTLVLVLALSGMFSIFPLIWEMFQGLSNFLANFLIRQFIEMIIGGFYFNYPSLGGRGINALVLFLYSANSGFCSIFFSSIGIPETFKMRYVIVIGPMILSQPDGTKRATIKIPHHCVTSPK